MLVRQPFLSYNMFIVSVVAIIVIVAVVRGCGRSSLFFSALALRVAGFCKE